MGQDDSTVIQVTNVAPQVTRDQLKILFGYLGEIDDIRLYPKVRHIGTSLQLRICFIKFARKSTAAIAQYISGTVLFDQALIVTLEKSGEIPDEDFALVITKNGTVIPSLCSSDGILPPHVVTRIIDSSQMVETFDPNLEANALPEYPPLPASYDSQKIDEVRRTVQIEDVDSNICNEDYLEFFSQVAEVNYMCRYTSTSNLKHCMLVEFSDQPSVIKVLKVNGSEFKGNPIKIVHATQAIVKPDNEAMQKRIVEALSCATISSPRRRSRSRSVEKRRRSRSKRRSRSRSRTYRRSRSRSRKRQSKSHKNGLEVEEKRSDRRHRSRSRHHKESRSHKRRSRSNSKQRSSKRKHSPSTSRDRKRDKKHDRRR